VDVGAGRELAAVAVEVLGDIAAVLEAVHDVVEIGGVGEAESVAGLVEAGEVDDGVAENEVGHGRRDDGGLHIDFGAAHAIDQDGPRLAVDSIGGSGPVEADVGALKLFGALQFELAGGGGLPGFNGPPGEFGVVRAANR
jgi:hypothetical protein